MSETKQSAHVYPQLDQYKWAAALMKAVIAEIGAQKAIAIAERAMVSLQQELGRDLAHRYGTSFEGLCQWLHDQVEKYDGYLSITEENDSCIKTKTSRCFAAEAMKMLGVPELLQAYCASDWAFTRAFSPDVEFSITHQISKGDPYCDHVWSRRDK